MTTETTGTPTSPTDCGETALDLKIQRFQQDVEIAHQIIHGDVNTEVQTENGLVASFAKRLADTNNQYIQQWETTLHSMQGVVAKTFWFPRAMVWHVVHNLNCVDFQESIRNVQGQKVIAHVNILNEKEFLVEFTEPEEGRISVVFFKDPVDMDGYLPPTQP